MKKYQLGFLILSDDGYYTGPSEAITYKTRGGAERALKRFTGIDGKVVAVKIRIIVDREKKK